MMRTISVNFTDFWGGFKKDDNFIINILNKKYNVKISDNPEFLFYSCFNNEFLKYDKPIRIFYTGENVRPDFNLCDYAIGFDRMNFGERYYRHIKFINKPELFNNIDYIHRKFCNFVYSNAKFGDNTAARIDFFNKLSKYKHIDSPGSVCNNMSNAIIPRDMNFEAGKLQFLKDYKFTIAFENGIYPGYITEKLYHPFLANSIPIYSGDPDIYLDFNTHAFVNCSDFNSLDDVVEYIKYLDSNDKAYMAMLRSQAMLNKNNILSMDDFIYNIIDNGKNFRKKYRIEKFHQPLQKYKKIFVDLWENLIQPKEHQLLNKKYISYNILNSNNEEEKIYNRDIFYPIFDKFKNSFYFCDVYQSLLLNDNLDPVIIRQHINVLQCAALYKYFYSDKVRPLHFINDKTENQYYIDLFNILWPRIIHGYEKKRIGPNSDGGFIILDTLKSTVFFNLGVHKYNVYDNNLVAEGFPILNCELEFKYTDKKYDFYITNNINNTKNNSSVEKFLFRDIYNFFPNIHDHEKILKLDLEGKEWDFFDYSNKTFINFFDQIVVEFHELNDINKFDYYIKIFNKILKTHIPIHFHFNNNGFISISKNFLFSSVLELTFINRSKYKYYFDLTEYPSSLDYPNLTLKPDIYIGNFDTITKNNFNYL